jgi:hypothetical protein
MQPVTLAADLDEVAMVHQPIEECRHGRRVPEELSITAVVT